MISAQYITKSVGNKNPTSGTYKPTEFLTIVWCFSKYANWRLLQTRQRQGLESLIVEFLFSYERQYQIFALDRELIQGKMFLSRNMTEKIILWVFLCDSSKW